MIVTKALTDPFSGRARIPMEGTVSRKPVSATGRPVFPTREINSGRRWMLWVPNTRSSQGIFSRRRSPCC